MSQINKKNNRVFGLDNALQTVNSVTIISPVNPTVNNIGTYGQIWINKVAHTSFICAGYLAGTGTIWNSIAAALVASAASPTATTTINSDVGKAVFTGFTTAAAASQNFVINDSRVTINSGLLVTVASVQNVNAVALAVTGVVIAAAGGSFTVRVTNNGAGALDSNVIISFWVIS